jgi:SAM-dependent methyltransferase
MRWYAFVYRLVYALGLRVWERRVPPSELVDLVEGPHAAPPGRALELGCGRGSDSVYLALHGWDVTGVDMVPRALAAARRRAAAAGVSARFVQGDVTRLGDLGVGPGHDLVYDFGCFHTLPADRRDAYVESVSGAAAPGGQLLLFGFRPFRLAPMHAGVTAGEVADRFRGHGWDLVGADRVPAVGVGVADGPLREQLEMWRYRLRRVSA